MGGERQSERQSFERIQAAWRLAAAARRVVIKIGSNLLTGGGENLQQAWIAGRVAEIVQCKQEGRQIILVTSGAVAAGSALLKLGRRPRSLRERQAAAAAGQGVLMGCYESCFAEHGFHTAQILLTREDTKNRQRYLNAKATMETLLELGLVPVVNENDTVVVEELRFGDNDTLAAMVAGLVNADLLILLSDVDGLYDADPHTNPAARRLALVEQVTPEIEALAGGVGSSVGSGGMVTKLKAAKKAARFGCSTILADGFSEQPILRLLTPTDSPAGTLFLTEGDHLSSRKRWIVDGRPSEGMLHLDEGAVRALFSGKSLLPKGIVRVVGEFERGATVYCLSPAGRRMAKGLVNYPAAQLRQIIGRHSSAIEEILGFPGDEEVIHRNNMVILEHS